MVADIISILNTYGNSTVQSIRNNLASTGTNATGKTSQSLRFEVKNEGSKITIKILGKPYLAVVETGRRDTPQYTKPSIEFVASIQEWMNAKGKEGSAYAIAKSIHQHGTKLFQKGGRQDIISNVINQGLINNISKDILNKFASQLVLNIKQVYGNNNN